MKIPGERILLPALLGLAPLFLLGCKGEKGREGKEGGEQSPLVKRLLQLSFDPAFNLLGPHSIHVRYTSECTDSRENRSEEHTLVINSPEDYRQEILRNGKRVYEVTVKGDAIYRNLGKGEEYTKKKKNIMFDYYWSKTWDFWKETLSPLFPFIRYREGGDGTLQGRWAKKMDLSLIQEGGGNGKGETGDEKTRGRVERVIPVNLSGYIWIDRETGAPLEMMVDGEFRKVYKRGRKKREYEKGYRFSLYQKIYDIGKFTSIEPPPEEKIIERRTVRRGSERGEGSGTKR